MKKLLAMLLATLLLGVGALGIAGCGPKTYGTFYTLQEAYDNGYLTREDLMSIAYYQNGGRRYNESIMPEDYAPIPKNPEELSDTKERTIKQTYWNDHFAENNPEDVAIVDICLEYYGCYHNCIIVMISYSSMPIGPAIWDSEIGGICFHYTSDNTLISWLERN